MKKLKLFISLWFTMFSMVVFGQAEYEKIAITQNTQDNTAGRLLVQDVTTGEVRWILKSILDNKFNQPTGDATQYLDGAGNPTTFPVLSQSDRVITEVRNSTGATITKGTVVYLNGATGGKPNVQKAQANAEATSSGTFGVIQSDINNNSNGYVVVIGTVLGLNTSAYTAGQVLWLSPTTAGGFTTTKPVAPNHAVYVGIVTLAATQGTIEVKIQNGYELDEIHDVLITSKTDNDGLIYDAMSGLWKNKQITKAMVGLQNVDNTSDLNKPISTATQTALNLKENTANKNTANGYAGLGSDGKLISSQLPAITITDTFVVGSQAAMLALTAETGDVAVRTDVNKSFILKGSSAGTLADWQELLTPTSSVTSVFGRQGAVTANNGDYTTALVTETTNKRYQTDIQQAYNDATSSIQTQLNAKANDNTVVHLAGSESVTGAKTFTSTPSFDSNIYLKHLSSWSNPAGYTVIGGRTDGFLLSASSTKSALIGLGNLTQAWTYDFPNKSGTFAMTSDVPTISGTTNYVTKFTGASTLGNSVIFDDGTNLGIGTVTPLTGGGSARWITANGTAAYSGGFIGSISGAAKMYLYSEAGFAKLQGTTGEGVKLEVNGGTTALTALSNGNVGIGTTTDFGVKLAVSGNMHVTNSDARIKGGETAGRVIVSNSDTSAYVSINGSANATPNNIALITNSQITFNTGASYSERMRINSDGNIGISITPNTWFNSRKAIDIFNGGAFVGVNAGWIENWGNSYLDSSATSRYLQNGNAGLYQIGNLSTGAHVWNTAVSGTAGNPISFIQAMTLTGSGNLGIGTTSPLNKLDVSGNISLSSGGANVFRILQSVQAAGYNGPGFYSQSDLGYGVGSGGAHRFIGGSDGNSELMRITSDGALILGTYSQTNDKVLDLRSNAGILSIVTSATNSQGSTISYSYANGSQGPLKFANAGGVVMTLQSGGSVNFPSLGTGLVYSNGGTLTSANPSDKRLKDNITDLRYGLSDILKLRPVSYNWKDDKINQGKQFGFIAQEVQEVMPELVKEFKTEEGNRLGLDKEGIYAALVNAIKEQQAQIKELQKEIEILKNK